MELTKKRSHFVAAVLLIIMFVLAVTSVAGDSAIMDEVAHIPAGYSYLKFQDYRLNPEHPPLIKAMAAAPLIFMDLKFPLDHPAWTTEANGQWETGYQFIYHIGNDADKMLFASRIPEILLMLLLGFFLYKWTAELYNRKAALLALFLYAFSPTIITHGRFVTTDLGVTVFLFIALYYFIKFIKKPGWKNLIIAGLTLGLAELAKYSAILLLPFFGIITLIAIFTKKTPPLTKGGSGGVLNKYSPLGRGQGWVSNTPETSPSPSLLRRGKSNISFARKGTNRLKLAGFYLGSLFLIFAIAYLLVGVSYQAIMANYPIEKQHQLIDASLLSSSLEIFGQEFDRDIIHQATNNPILRPYAQYFLGLVMVTNHVESGHSAFLMGEFSNQGWWYYFPVAFLIKIPLALHILILITLIFFLYKIIIPLLRISPFIKGGQGDFWKRLIPPLSRGVRGIFLIPLLGGARGGLALFNNLLSYLWKHLAEIAMFGIIATFALAGITGKLNIGIRYMLPILPFIYILVSGQIIQLLDSIKNRGVSQYAPAYKYLVSKILLFALLGWYLLANLNIYPSYLAYFNELIGGPDKGSFYLVDSNLDWGQDLKRLDKWIDDYNQDCENIGETTKNNLCADLTREPITKIKVDYFGGGVPAYYLGNKFVEWHANYGPTDGWLAVSGGFIQMSKHENPLSSYEYLLENHHPVAKIGYSIFIYYLEP